MTEESTPDSDSESQAPTTAPSSPPDMEKPQDTDDSLIDDDTIQKIRDEERAARVANQKAEAANRKRLAAKRKKARAQSFEEREKQAKQLDELLAKSAAFSDILTKKTEVLGRVGSSLDGAALGEHQLEMAKQPKIMSGGKMRDYQLEGLTWMYEICSQGMSGILADEMGLGKTIQTISLIALLREQEGYMGPHLIVAPLSTLSNWIEEFHKWTPDVPVVLYHGTKDHREQLRKFQIMKHIKNNRPSDKFPVVVTSYEIILRDKTALAGINWEFIIIDEGHRLKNFDSALFRELRTFTSATRLLITGTPLQNNLKELWSLLHFLLPNIFTNWEAFESWFDFSDLQDEEGTEEFIADQKKQDLVKKIHLVLQPMLLRRIKADVEHMLPKKREYVLYAPMTQQQTELYTIMADKNSDPRKYLEDKVVERLTGAANTPSPTSRRASPLSKTAKPKAAQLKSEEAPLILAHRNKTRKAAEQKSSTTPAEKPNAFDRLMAKKPSPAKATRSSSKRKSNDSLSISAPNKSAKSSRQSTPGSVRGSARGRRTRKNYTEADASEEDELSDDEFEQKLAEELTAADLEVEDDDSNPEEVERAKTLELAKKEIATKKLGNPLMQLRLVCNSPHNFFNPWNTDSELAIDETLVTQSGKMLLLDRLLPSLFERGHKVLIFSQFKTQLDLIEDYARDLRRWNVCRIDGSVAQDDRRQQIKDFNTDPDHKLFLLSTRAGGQGINLASADTVILFDSDWNPQQDLQAIDRAHRIGQQRPVVVFRLATKGTVEEDLLLSADAKRRLEKLVIKKGGFRSLATKMDNQEQLDERDLRALLLKEGQVFQHTGTEQILSDADLDVLCDRSDEAYARAEKGLGNAAGFTVVETKAGGLMTGMGEK
ncbi:MAG: hypothetical protein M1818_006274 [Claussenomyces sp. TS43310]|nr:MAG: hypothetical protein M1818_006274 [Claussenomyces sp. TS43310]